MDIAVVERDKYQVNMDGFIQKDRADKIIETVFAVRRCHYGKGITHSKMQAG